MSRSVPRGSSVTHIAPRREEPHFHDTNNGKNEVKPYGRARATRDDDYSRLNFVLWKRWNIRRSGRSTRAGIFDRFLTKYELIGLIGLMEGTWYACQPVIKAERNRRERQRKSWKNVWMTEVRSGVDYNGGEQSISQRFMTRIIRSSWLLDWL